MSNNNTNNTIRSSNVYSSARTDDEMAMLIDRSNALGTDDTTINIENDMGPSTSQQQRLHLSIRRESNPATRINMDLNNSSSSPVAGGTGGMDNTHIDERQRLRNLFTMLRDARHQFHRQHSSSSSTAMGRDPRLPMAVNESQAPRSWRENLYDVLASPVTQRTDVLRTLFTPSTSGNFRYNTLPTNDNPTPEEHFHFLLNSNSLDHDVPHNHQHQRNSQVDLGSGGGGGGSAGGVETQTNSTSGLRLSRQSSRLEDRSGADSTTSPTSSTPTPVTGDPLETAGSRRQSNVPATDAGGSGNNGRLPQRQASLAGSNAPTIDMDDPDTNAMGEMIVKIVSHFVRYLPFICILLIKFVHDHLLGIIDLVVLQAVMFQVNKSLKEQVAKVNQKSYAVLTRDTILVVCVVTYRFLLAPSTPDPFGLLINPPGEKLTLDLSFSSDASHAKADNSGVIDVTLAPGKHESVNVSLDPTSNPMGNDTISLGKSVSLGVLLYYIAVNDLVLKLLTQLVKIFVTMLPTRVIRHKSRARLYASIEYISQYYRALVPIRQWITYLFESYTGLEIISGILLSSFYLGAKGFEFVERWKSLKKALVNFIRNMDYDRKPTKDELDAAGTVCPICHDAYTTPVVLECSHIFCDDCVNTWFKREQTCPMCRAKVSEDPTWQDGATTFFYQMF
uniref:Ring finger domain protein n=1 Tax=Musca domestica TaxID=7370 RepID=T1PI99_MUSDO